MKKNGLFILVSLVVALCLVAVIGNSAVSACTTVPTDPNAKNVSWDISVDDPNKTEIPQEEFPGAPPTDQQAASSGLVLSEPATICYPFYGGQFGWVGQIRMWSGDAWLPLPTTTAWTPDEEGVLMACAEAPAAGTFALFAYWAPEE